MSSPPAGARRILLVTMPLADPILPNLAIEQLAAIARSSAEACDVLYGTLLLPKSVPRSMIHGMPGATIFTPLYFDVSREEVAAGIAQVLIEASDGEYTNREETLDAVALEFLLAMEAAELCLRRCLAAIEVGRYDVVGFSVGFDAQKLPSAALARHIKAREPHLRILFGGTGCDGDMGRALMELFPEVDAVVQDEAEATFLPAVAALRGEQPFDTVGNCLYRVDREIVETDACAPATSLDEVPTADYHSYLEQRAASPYGTLEKIVLFETSRGCWWGAKQHCRFCGIRAVDFAYRTRSPQNAIGQILELRRRYAPDLFYSTDSILSLGYLKSVLPELARLRREEQMDFTFFYEIKSNMRREHVALLAAAGVTRVQPGIESFSTNSLRLMNKGATGLQQIELLKWAQAYDIAVIYGLLVGTPGETVDDLEAMTGLLPALHHLPPPVQVNPLGLHKFSPYAADATGYGLRDVRPYPAQRIIYQATDELLMRLCYELKYTSDNLSQPATRNACKRLAAAVRNWQHAYLSGERMVMTLSQDAIIITRRLLDGVRIWALTGNEAALYRHCQHVNSLELIAGQTGMSLNTVVDTANRLASKGLLAIMDGRCLALAVPADADAWHDANLDQSLLLAHQARAMAVVPSAAC